MDPSHTDGLSNWLRVSTLRIPTGASADEYYSPIHTVDGFVVGRASGSGRLLRTATSPATPRMAPPRHEGSSQRRRVLVPPDALPSDGTTNVLPAGLRCPINEHLALSGGLRGQNDPSPMGYTPALAGGGPALNIRSQHRTPRETKPTQTVAAE